MIKPNFELFLINQNTVGVVAKSRRIFNELQKEYKRFPGDAKWRDGEEPMFRVPLTDSARLKALLGIRGGTTFDLKEVLT